MDPETAVRYLVFVAGVCVGMLLFVGIAWACNDKTDRQA